MRKVLFMINSLKGGGAEKLLTDILRNLPAALYDITVLTFSPGGLYEKAIPDNVKHKFLFQEKDRWSWLKLRIIAFILPPTLAYKLCIKDEYDVEVAFLEGPVTRIISGSSNKHAKKYAWVHYDLYTNFATRKLFLTTKGQVDCYKKYNQVICVSNNTEQAFVKRFGETHNTVVRYNFIDNEDIDKKVIEVVPDYTRKGQMLFISVGRLVPAKGFDRLIRAYGKLKKEGYEFQAAILGEGKEKSQLEQLIGEYDLGENVHLLGFVNNPYPIIKQADAFILSSRYEGYGLVIAEAMYLGIPVIATNCEGAKDILKNGKYGMVVENSTEGIYNALNSIMDNPSTLHKYNMALRVKDFLKNKRMKEIEELFI